MRINLLVLEDERLLHTIYRKIVDMLWPEVTYIPAYSVAEAIEIASETSIDCAILDGNLPDGKSCDFLKYCLENDIEFEAVMISGEDDKSFIEHILNVYRNYILEFIPKPASVDVFRTVITCWKNTYEF